MEDDTVMQALRENPLEEEAKKKAEHDHGALLDKELPPLEQQARLPGQLQAASEAMLALEKKCRQSADSDSTLRVANALVQAAFDVNDLAALNSVLALLAKRRGQFKRVTLGLVNLAITMVERLPAKEAKLALIGTLRSITEGKMFVENERARLTRQLARMKEEEGDAAAASKLMQELQIETYNTMEKREKTDFILEQMRLCLDTGDFARAQIISRKISERLLNHTDFQHEKERYYRMMIRYYSHVKQYLDVCRSYLSIYNTPSVKADESKKVVLFVVLSRYDNEQKDLLARVSGDKNLEKLPLYASLLELFARQELVHWPHVQSNYVPVLRASHSADLTDELLAGLETRVVEHNVLIIALYYKQVTVQRMAELLHRTKEQTEAHVSDLVTSKMIWARIDRPRGVITFRPKQNANQLMDDWSSNIKELLSKLDACGHAVHRELVQHKIGADAVPAEVE